MSANVRHAMHSIDIVAVHAVRNIVLMPIFERDLGYVLYYEGPLMHRVALRIGIEELL